MRVISCQLRLAHAAGLLPEHGKLQAACAAAGELAGRHRAPPGGPLHPGGAAQRRCAGRAGGRVEEGAGGAGHVEGGVGPADVVHHHRAQADVGCGIQGLPVCIRFALHLGIRALPRSSECALSVRRTESVPEWYHHHHHHRHEWARNPARLSDLLIVQYTP